MSTVTSSHRSLVRVGRLLTGAGRSEMIIASAAAAVALLSLLFLAAAVVDLLVTNGDLKIARSETPLLPSWIGTPDALSATHFEFQNRGLLPLFWHWGNLLGDVGGKFYAGQPWLQSNEASLLTLCALAIVMGAILFAALAWLDRCVKWRSADIVSGIRRDIYRQTLRLGESPSLRAVRSPENLFADAAETLRYALAHRWKTFPAAPLALALLAAAALAAHFWWTLSAMLALSLLWYVAARQFARARRQRRLLADRADYQMLALTESLKHVPLVNGYQLAETPGTPFDETVARHERQTRELRANSRLGRLVIQVAVVVVVACLVALAGRGMLLGQATAFQTAFAALCLAGMGWPFRQIAAQASLDQQGEHAAEEIFRFLDRQPKVAQATDAVQLSRLSRGVELQNVSLHDESGNRVLDNVSFNVPLGRRIAVLATDGLAHHALSGLLARFCDPTSGRVLYDGQDIRSATFASLRRQLALVPQEGLLFAASVRDNIACGDPRFTDDDVIRAAKHARAYDFVQRLPQAFETTVGQHGLWLDSGESLRIGLARAVLRDPALLVVEEPWEELDQAQAGEVDAALAAAGENRTVITLATRLTTLRGADEVLLFHEGKLHAQGPHDELVQHSDLYRHIVYMRFNEYGHSGPQIVSARQAG